MNKEIMECLSRIREAFPKAFINLRMELILEPKNNVYFRLGDISTELSFKRKLIEYASRSCVKGVSSYYQKQMLNGVNEFLETEFTAEEMELIYTRLGNGCNSVKCTEFMLSGYDLELLKTKD